MLRIYDVGGKLLSGIKSMYVDSSACVRVKWGVSCPLGCSMYIGIVMKEMGKIACREYIYHRSKKRL